jgi:RNA polymerase sigma-70 factor (ECF subfamily)
MTQATNGRDRSEVAASLPPSTEDVARERAMCAAFASGDMKRAATLMLDEYGMQIARFLAVRLRSQTLADEAFSQFCEDMWRGLPAFRWTAPARVWLWVLARNAATRVVTAGFRKRELLVDRDEAFAHLAQHVRTATARFLSTSTKHRLRELRGQLADDEQTLLILRVDRKLSWKELAVVMGEITDETDEAGLARASARVRTRYQVVKQRLRELAQEAGLAVP